MEKKCQKYSNIELNMLIRKLESIENREIYTII